jgi:hypothetical protein
MKSLYDCVQIERRFSRSARLDADLKGTPPLVGYVLQASTRKVLETLASAQAESLQGAFTWTGPYGSGKSSAALLLGNVVGGSRLNRQLARKIAGSTLTEALSIAFPDRRKSWAVVPVTGSRTDLCVAVGEAAAKILRWSTAAADRAKSSGAGLMDALLKAKAGGVLLLIDELGKFLEHAVEKERDIHLLQDLAELSSRSGGRLVIVGILHQAFEVYAGRQSREVRQEWAKVQGRFQDIAFLAGADETVALLSRAITVERRPADAAKQAAKVAELIAERRPTHAGDLARALTSTWPLNPVTALLLGPVSRQRFAQNERSVFGFLSSAEPFGFLEYLKSEPKTSGFTYGPDRLWDYLASNFGLALASGTDGARFSLAFEAIERAAAKGTDLHVILAKAAAVIELFRNGSGLAVTKQLLQCCVPSRPIARVDSAIEDLIEWAVFMRQPRLGGYAMFAGSDFDIESAIEKTRAKPAADELLELPQEAGLGIVVAKRHYFRTGVLRAFQIVLQMVGNKEQIPETARRLSARRPRSSGMLVLALSDGDISDSELAKRAKALSAELDRSGMVAAVGAVKNSDRVMACATEMLTLARLAKEYPQLEGDRIARREISARRSASMDALHSELTAELSSCQWWLGPCTDRCVRERPAVIATQLADAAYPLTPILRSELVQRDRPSSNAMAAVRDLAHAMVDKRNLENLDISGFPAAMGLYLTVIKPFGLHRRTEEGPFAFFEPDRSALGKTVRPLFRLLTDAKEIDLERLYATWSRRPYGLKLGVMPIFALAGILSKRNSLAVYVDGVFQTQLDTFFVDKLLQNPGAIRLQTIDRSIEDTTFLRRMAELLGLGGEPTALSVAQALFRRFRSLPEYAKRTSTVSEECASLRAKVLQANDPESLLFRELTQLDFGKDKAAAVIQALESAERSYSDLLDTIRLDLANALGTDAKSFTGLKRRATSVNGLTNDLRFDALANRAAAFETGDGSIEEFASLLLHKPAASWTDRDREQALLEIARFGRSFREIEALALVRKRKPSSEALALVVGLNPGAPTLLKSFELTEQEGLKADALAKKLVATLGHAPEIGSVRLGALARAVAIVAETHSESAR